MITVIPERRARTMTLKQLVDPEEQPMFVQIANANVLKKLKHERDEFQDQCRRMAGLNWLIAVLCFAMGMVVTAYFRVGN